MDAEDALTWIEQAELGNTDGRMVLNGCEEFRRTAARLAAQASREILIFTHDLDPPVYDQVAFIEALKQLILSGRSARVWVLLQRNERVQREGHRLIELGRRLPSRIEIRRVHKDHADHPECFLVADETGFLHQHRFSRHQGSTSFHAPLEARQHRSYFLDVWRQSTQDSDLRRLHL